ncbi:MAG: DNA repair protein RecN [Eubacteriales bacterium]|nr:DNA repair protein RecN [Eubacteriales bacterium]
MLLELNVRDIALIKEAEVNFREGLNIMTGETGAGKSVIIGSCMLALGAKAKSDVIREGAESAYIELVFSIDDDSRKEKIEAMGIDTSEGTIVISRKISPGRSVSRINGEAVSLTQLREIASLLIDVYGQNEFQTLMDEEKHLGILDAYLAGDIRKEKADVAEAFRSYKAAKANLAGFNLDEYKKEHEAELCRYEIDEIENAKLKEGEEEELEVLYKRLNNSKNIIEYMDRAHGLLSENYADSALMYVEEALRYDEGLKGIRDELNDAADILNDALREISSYVSGLELSESTLRETEERLDLIRGLENKYGRTVEDIFAYRDKKAERLNELNNYDENKLKAEAELKRAEDNLKKACDRLTKKRRDGSKGLCERLEAELLELGFESVKAEFEFSEKPPAENGADRVCLKASLNRGARPEPVNEVASGGELSRIMLSIKTVLAKSDDIPTLIFDEIDAGISGRTAQRVAEKLALIGVNHQVICITHLPQIASMADTHYVIEKMQEDDRNVTSIRRLNGDEPEGELARLLGGAEITESVLTNAREMKKLACEVKERKRTEAR